MTATQERTAVDAVPTQLFIGGEWREATGGATLDVEDPSCTAQAASSAALASSGVASATLAIVSPVDGSSMSSVAPPDASRHSPPMNSCVLTLVRARFS